jgi:hypothetical protein
VFGGGIAGTEDFTDDAPFPLLDAPLERRSTLDDSSSSIALRTRGRSI